ncbi:MAG TPA: PAS domain-containing protein [Candidatus Paceibacterota bacterium]|nr:PAS domain-containing protein [Verrucomicrobiota bacterium]HRY50285.1 PAS domain-containing protein [Candidatus Paceibacterota bacterium]
MWIRYGTALVAVAAGFGLRKTLTLCFGEDLPTYITFYPAVMVAALLAGLGPGIASTVLSVIVVDYWISSPRDLWIHTSPGEAVGALLFTVMGVFISLLTDFYRYAREKSASSEKGLVLRESESFYRQTLELIPGMVFTTRPDGYCDFLSQQWFDFTGVPMSENLGDGWNSLLHPEDSPRALATWREAVKGGTPYDVEYRVRRRDGSYEWFKVLGRPIRNTEGQIIRWFGTALNVHDLVKAQTALRHSERIYRAIGESIDYGIWICEPDGRNIYASESFLSLVGITQEQCSNFGWGDVLHPDDAEKTIASWKECVRTGGIWDVEHRFRGVDGEYHSILARGVPVKDERGEVICWAGINLDISRLKGVESALAQARANLERTVEERTARLRRTVDKLRATVKVRREAEKKIKEAELQYRTVADFTYDWEYWLTPEGSLRYCSPSCERITGHTAAEFVADPICLGRLIHPDDRDLWQQHERDALACPGQRSIQFRILRKDGELRWIEHACQPVIDSGGAFLGVRAGNCDITQRKQAELETQRLRTELARISRLTTAGQMAAALAHELNQPLGAIVCNTQAAEQLLRQNPPNLAEVQEILLDIQADGKRAGEVIHGLRALYQQTGEKRADLRLNQIIQETVRLLNSEFLLRCASAELNLDPQLPTISGDAIELQQVIINLVVNALDAMATKESNHRFLQISTQCRDAKNVEIAFRDAGTGLSAEILNRLGEPFFTTKATGMGMGLAISLSIAESHGGRLWAENNADQGATFYLSLPILSNHSI